MKPKSVNLAEISEYLRSKEDYWIERLVSWCDQNSWSLDRDALCRMAETLVADFAEIGVDFQMIDLPDLRLLGETKSWVRQSTGPALLWHLNEHAKRRILLMIHYDTVYPADSSPSVCVRNGNKLVGPGVADAKGGIAVIAAATDAILKLRLLGDAPGHEQEQECGFTVLLNPDEEIGSTASADLIKELCSQFDAALVFEPPLPSGALVAARKGSGNFSIVVEGRSAHAGRNPTAGRNAVVRAAELIVAIERIDVTSNGLSINIGKISGGGALNQVPDHAVVQINIRAEHEQAVDWIEQRLREICRDFSGDGYQANLVGEFHCPPKIVTPEIEALQDLVSASGDEAGRQIRWQDTGGACDGSKLAAWGLPNIDTMSVSGSGLHSSEEMMLVDSFVPAVMTTISAMRRLWQD